MTTTRSISPCNTEILNPSAQFQKGLKRLSLYLLGDFSLQSFSKSSGLAVDTPCLQRSLNSLLSSAPLPIFFLTVFVCLITLPSHVICSIKMRKYKSHTVVLRSASNPIPQQLIFHKRQKRIVEIWSIYFKAQGLTHWKNPCHIKNLLLQSLQILAVTYKNPKQLLLVITCKNVNNDAAFDIKLILKIIIMFN